MLIINRLEILLNIGATDGESIKKIQYQWSLYRKIEMEKNNCTLKEKIMTMTAVGAFILGWALTIAGFIVPPLGEVADSVLWVLGQSLLYCSGIFGVATYFKSETVQMKRDMQRYFNEKERLQIERMKLRNGVDEGEIPDEEDE